MSKEQDNKAIVGRWFSEFWGPTWNPAIVDELCTADILLQYSLHAPRRGRADVKAGSGRMMRFTGTAVLRVENGKIAEEIGLDDGVTALTQLGLIRAA